MSYCPDTSKERKFRPNYKCKELTEKFYARHENSATSSQESKRLTYFENEIEKRLRYDARNRYYAPITENQTYGWLERSAEKYTGLDQEILMHNIPFDETMNVMKEVSFYINREKLFKKLL